MGEGTRFQKGKCHGLAVTHAGPALLPPHTPLDCCLDQELLLRTMDASVLRMGGEGVSLPPNLHPQLPWVGNAPISRGKHAFLGGAHLGPCWWL